MEWWQPAGLWIGKTEMHSNLWVFPKGMERNGETGANSLKWTSKYGSVVTSAFEIASTDGMNEKGLVCQSAVAARNGVSGQRSN